MDRRGKEEQETEDKEEVFKVRERLTRHADDGATNVHRLLDAPWSDEALASDATRRLLSRRGCVKEICEAFAAADVVRTLAPAAAADGSGLTILDVCSGSGLGAAVLSRVWPEARVVMLDSNREMDLAHVSERANLDFIELDLFAKNAAAVLSDASAGAGTCVVLGVHLCGALSPRLITLCAHVDGIDAFGHGDQVFRSHEFSNRLAGITGKSNVAIGKNTN